MEELIEVEAGAGPAAKEEETDGGEEGEGNPEAAAEVPSGLWLVRDRAYSIHDNGFLRMRGESWQQAGLKGSRRQPELK